MTKILVAVTIAVAGLISSAHAQAANYGQCGGEGWTGATTCNSGWTCVYSNEWYSQCLQGTATTTTTAKATSTTHTTTSSPAATATSKGTFTNPIKTTNGSDPFMVYSNGYYYLMTTTWTDLEITRATTIKGLKTATPKVIWTDTTASRCCNLWAPEIHWMATENKWFIYYTAGSSSTLDDQRIYTLQSSGTDIWASTWSFAARIVIPNRDVWSIDQTVWSYNGINYLLFSSNSGTTVFTQSLYIAQMSSATTVGNAVLISSPTYSWETVGASVNEGPQGLTHSGRNWIFFSASYCVGTGYTLGRLELTGTNPLSASSWTKYSQPVLSSANGNDEPGHNGFFAGPSGDQYIVFHASATSPAVCDGSRYTMVQPISYDSSGEPVLAPPAPLSQAIPEPY